MLSPFLYIAIIQEHGIFKIMAAFILLVSKKEGKTRDLKYKGERNVMTDRVCSRGDPGSRKQD